jgi:hypothetical protein
MKYPILKQTEHAFDVKTLDQACAVLEDEQLYDLHHLLCCDFDHDAQSLEEVVWTVTPANQEREEYEVSGVRELIALIKKSYCFHTCAGWGTIDSDVGCSDVELYGYFARRLLGLLLDLRCSDVELYGHFAQD